MGNRNYRGYPTCPWQERTGRPGRPSARPPTLDDVLAAYRVDQCMPNPAGLWLGLAAVVANRADDRLWLILVTPPSAGKSTLLDGFDRLPEAHRISSFTTASLLPAHASRSRPDGILDRIGQGGQGLLVVKDLTLALKSATSETEVDPFDLLRLIYDGEVDRQLGSHGGQHRYWQGRVGLLAGCTEIIDRWSNRLGSLGERFLHVPLPSLDRQVLRLWVVDFDDEVIDPVAIRAQRAATVAAFVDSVDLTASVPVGPFDRDLLFRLADFATTARSAVWRDGPGGIISLVPEAEMPMRVFHVFRAAFRALVRLGLPRAEAWRQVLPLALGAVPKSRRLPLINLLTRKGWVSTADLANDIQLPEGSVVGPLEDLAAHGVVEREARNVTGGISWRAAPWIQEMWRLITEGGAPTGALPQGLGTCHLCGFECPPEVDHHAGCVETGGQF